MADGIVQVPPDSTGKKIDADELTVGANTVERQRVRIGGSTAAGLAEADVANGLDVDVTRLPAGSMAAAVAKTADLDTGAGADTVPIVGIALPASGGAVAGGTATNPVRVDPTGTTTQPVSLASAPLPAGAATEASLATVATAAGAPADAEAAGNGSFIAILKRLRTLLGGGLPSTLSSDRLKVDGSAVTQPVSGTVAVTAAASSQADGHSVTLGAQADAAAGSDTATASYLALFKRLLQRVTTLIGQLPSALVSGRLDVNLGAAPATVTVTGTVTANAGTGTLAVDSELPAAAALADAAANPTAPMVGAANLVYNGSTWDRARGDTGNGLDVDVTRLPALVAGAAKIGGVDLDSDATPGSAVPGTAQYVAGTDGTNARGLKTDAAGELQVDVLTLPALAAGTNLVGRVNPEPQTANGLSISRTISAGSTNATSVKVSAGQVYAIYAHNLNAAVRYLKLYNKASSPTVGTDTPVMTVPIPGNTAGAGVVVDTGGMGIAFGTGIALALTTGVADADTGAVAANEIVVTLLYK